MMKLSTPIALLLVICGVSIQGASIPRNLKYYFQNINLNNSSAGQVHVLNQIGNSSTGKYGALKNHKIQEQLKRLQPSLKSSEIIVINGTGGNFDQLKSLLNIPEAQIEKMVENLIPKIDGRWAKWSEWNDCSVTCGDGISIRRRTCIGPINGGKACQGNGTESRPCNTKKCPVRPRNLAIIFDPKQFEVKFSQTRNYGEEQYIFINDSKLSNDPTFLDVKELLALYLTNAGQISKIWQHFGDNNNFQEVVRVTSIDDAMNPFTFCDAEGRLYGPLKVQPKSHALFRANDKKRLMISEGDCRTILWISS